jgi:predicted nucleotidyltransferase component of viral defense system
LAYDSSTQHFLDLEHAGDRWRTAHPRGIERDYVLAWFLTDLAGHPFREMLVLKGGTALRRRWFVDYRFSEDLDFTLPRRITFEKIMVGLNEIFAIAKDISGLRIAFDREDRHNHQNSHTFYS